MGEEASSCDPDSMATTGAYVLELEAFSERGEVQ